MKQIQMCAILAVSLMKLYTKQDRPYYTDLIKKLYIKILTWTPMWMLKVLLFATFITGKKKKPIISRSISDFQGQKNCDIKAVSLDIILQML